MSKDAIRTQIEAMHEGYKKELADYMDKVYVGNAGWPDDPRTDLLDAPTWTPPEPGQFSWSNASAITVAAHERLKALRDRAGGWFYLKDGQLVFVAIEQWKQIKGGWREP